MLLKRTKVLFVLAALLAGAAFAAPPNQVYRPTVTLLERELEWRALHLGDIDTTHHALAYATALSPRWMLELAALATTTDERTQWHAYEAELTWQLTEQGEFAYDYGLVWELEHNQNSHATAVGTTLVVARDWQRLNVVANLHIEYEHGPENEWEAGVSSQWRYRYARTFEPSFEFYWFEQHHVAGPLITGRQRLAAKRAITWEAGVLAGLDDLSPDWLAKFALEFEF